MANQTPLAETIPAKLAAQKRIGMWNGVGALCGSPSQVGAAKQTIRSVLRKSESSHLSVRPQASAPSRIPRN